MMSSEPGRPRAVVCLSGGMDSCVCATLAARDYDVYALHFSYGQRTERGGLLAAQDIAPIPGARELLHLKIDIVRRLGGPPPNHHRRAGPHAPAEEPRRSAPE